MKPKILYFVVAMLLAVCACTKDNIVGHGPEEGPLKVRFQDVSASCTWNLVTLNHVMIFDFNQTRQDSFLHSDINQFDEAQDLEFGDTLTIKYQVLPSVPDGYEAPLNICNRNTGIVIKILEIIE